MVQVSGQPSLQEDDEVSFAAGVNVATGARKATSVQLLVKADGQSVRRELGQVCLAHGRSQEAWPEAHW